MPDLHYNGTEEALPSICLGREDPTVFAPFSSWHWDFQVSHTSCLDAKNRFPQGWAKSRRTMHSANIKRMHVHILWYSVSSIEKKGRDKMLLIKVNMIKSLFRFFRNQWRGFKALSLWQKTLMLYVTGGIKTPSLQSLVSEQWAWFTNREERQRGRLIWSQQTGPVRIIVDTGEQYRGRGRSEEEEGGMEV